MDDKINRLINSLPFELSGPESEFPIVLVPDGLSGWVSWKPHAEVLSRDNKVLRVQLLNLVAAERNKTPGKKYSLRSESNALKATLDNLGIKKIHLVGWSQGGAIALDFALNYSNQIRSLTLIEPATYWVARAHGQFDEEEKEFQKLFKGLPDIPTEHDLIHFLTMNGLVKPNSDPRSLPQWYIWNSLKIALLSLHVVIDHSDDAKRLKILRDKPILLVKGKDSVGFNAGIVRLLLSALGPRTEVLILPDAHTCHIIAKDQFLMFFRKFINAIRV